MIDWVLIERVLPYLGIVLGVVTVALAYRHGVGYGERRPRRRPRRPQRTGRLRLVA